MRALTTTERDGTRIRHRRWGTEGVIQGSVMGGFNVYIPSERTYAMLPFERVNEWEVVEQQQSPQQPYGNQKEYPLYDYYTLCPTARYVGGVSKYLCECPQPLSCPGVIAVQKALRKQQQSPQSYGGNPGTKCVAPGCSKPAVTTLYLRGIPYKVCLSHYAQYQR